jgi:hypothetical protein
VLVEAFVLDGDHGVGQVRRDLADRDDLAVLEVEVGEELAVGRVDLRRLSDLEGVRVVDAGQPLERIAHVEPCPARRRDDDDQHERADDCEDGRDDAGRAVRARAPKPA